jgi:hypothetical protein
MTLTTAVKVLVDIIESNQSTRLPVFHSHIRQSPTYRRVTATRSSVS